MAKIAEAMARLMANKYVCKVCKSVSRAPSLKINLGVVKCRRCQSKKFRVKRKK